MCSEVGADVLYAPALPDLDAIRAVVRAVAPKPVNVLIGPKTGPVPLATLEAIGVKRVSLGGALYRHALAALRQAADAIRRGGVGAASSGVSAIEVEGWWSPAGQPR